ncbi:hypothetical protein HpBT260_11800 [Helicobacter pylori]
MPMQALKNKAFRVSIQWNVLVRKLLSLERSTLTYSKNDSFKVVGGYFAMNISPQLTPLKTLVKIQPKLFIKLAQKTPSFKDTRCKRTAVRLYPS